MSATKARRLVRGVVALWIFGLVITAAVAKAAVTGKDIL